MPLGPCHPCVHRELALAGRGNKGTHTPRHPFPLHTHTPLDRVTKCICSAPPPMASLRPASAVWAGMGEPCRALPVPGNGLVDAVSPPALEPLVQTSWTRVTLAVSALAGDKHLVLAPAAAASRVTWSLALMGTACPPSQGTLGAVPYKSPQLLPALSISSHCPALPLLGEILKPSSK